MNLHNFAVSLTLPVPVPYQPDIVQMVPFNIVVTHYTESQAMEQVNATYPGAKDLKITDMGEIVSPSMKAWLVEVYLQEPGRSWDVMRLKGVQAETDSEAVAQTKKHFELLGCTEIRLKSVKEGTFYDHYPPPKE